MQGRNGKARCRKASQGIEAAHHFGNVEALLNATQEELVECEGIGPERAEAIADAH